MTPWFADTFFYLALLNEKDEAHARAVEAQDDDERLTVTTEFIMIEVADHLSDGKNRRLFVTLYEILRLDASVEIVPASEELLGRGRELYVNRPGQRTGPSPTASPSSS